MGWGPSSFWLLFGGIWLIAGAAFFAVSMGVHLFADPAALNQDMPLWPFVLVGLAASSAGGTIIYFARRAVARDRRLMQSGILLTATVIDIERSPIRINRQSRWHVLYRYEYTKGRPIDGRSTALAGETVQGFRPGDRVNIKVDPQKPEESLFLGA